MGCGCGSREDGKVHVVSVRVYGDRPTRFDRSAVSSGGRVGGLPVGEGSSLLPLNSRGFTLNPAGYPVISSLSARKYVSWDILLE